ncbi:FOG: HEAT repeat [hydrothermal vent metagenome]|uniref:FOG: HEAT repeat n=1 Tax=hydrothermal vent metagenome TaxID=652676 RepID=A0A3B1BPN2_9ZZZZ
MQAPIIKSIIDQHAEEAAFLWLQRHAAVCEPHYSLKDLAHLDDRLEANIDGLRIAGDAGWEICEEALTIKEPGEIFTAAVLAFEGDDGRRVDEVITASESTPENLQALVSALGWIDDECFQRWVPGMANASADIYRYLAISAYAIRQLDPGEVLGMALQNADPLIQARALRAVGEFKQKNLLPVLKQFDQSNDLACRFWSAWSGVLLSDPLAIDRLKTFVAVASAYREPAIQLLLRIVDIKQSQLFLNALSKTADSQRLIARGTGMVGDPVVIPWLIELMMNPELARVAGESFSMITGVDIAYDDLEGEWPDGFEAGPTENPQDEDVAMDPDEDLPWPEPSLIRSWWQENSKHFRPGTRYLCGQPISVEYCQKVLRDGYQRQRRAATLELALLQADAPLFNTSAPGFLQQNWLAE